jgi:hypothetical protein
VSLSQFLAGVAAICAHTILMLWLIAVDASDPRWILVQAWATGAALLILWRYCYRVTRG